MRGVLRVKAANHFDGMPHRRVRRGEIFEQFRVIHFDIGDDGRAGRGDEGFRIRAREKINVGSNGEFRAETHVKDGLDADAFQPAVHVQMLIGEVRRNRRRDNGDGRLAAAQSRHRVIEVIQI